MNDQTNPSAEPSEGSEYPSIDSLLDGSLDGAAEALYRRMNPTQDPNPAEGAEHDDSKRKPKGQGQPDGDAEAPSEGEQDEDQDAEQEGDEPNPDANPDDEFVELELEPGKTYQVPKELKDGYLRQADYSRKTQEVAEEKKAAAASALHGQLLLDNAPKFAEVLAQIKILDNQLEQYGKLDWQKMRSENAGEYAAYAADYQTARMNRQTLEQQYNALPGQLAQELEKARDERRKAILPEVKKRIPEWGPKTDEQVMKFGMAIGFAPEELRNGALDPRIIQVLYLASKQQALQQSKPQITKRVAQAAQRVVKPGASPGPRGKNDAEADAKARFQKSGSSDDAVALMEARLLKGGYR